MAVKRGYRAKLRISVLISELNPKGGDQNRSGREKSSRKVVTDYPVMDIPDSELAARITAINRVVKHGWELTELPPPEVFLGDLILNPDTLVLSMSGKVVSNNVATTCGFQITPEPTFDLQVPSAADESPVTSADEEKINADFPAFFFQGWTFYIRAFATDGVKTVYSIVKSIEIPVLPV